MTIECDHHGALILPSAAGASPGTCSRCGEDIAGREPRRASGLTAARGENSVLFSLDSLRALNVETRPEPAPRPHAPEPARTEGSGLIDVRALGAMIRPAGQASRPTPRRFDALTASPATLTPAAVAVRGPTPVAPAPTSLVVLLGIVALGMMALMGHLATRGPSRGAIVIERHVSAAPAAAPAEEAAEAPQGSAEAPQDSAEAPRAPVAAAEPPPPEEPARSPRRVKRPPAPAAGGEPPVKPATPTPAAGPAPDSVECLLSADRCKKEPGAAPPAVEARPDPADSLPEKLEPGELIEGTRAAKAAALERCRSHARGGEKVTIKLSISGPAGSVLSASAQDDAGNPALANCAAAELKRATFKKVRKPQVGAVATLKF